MVQVILQPPGWELGGVWGRKLGSVFANGTKPDPLQGPQQTPGALLGSLFNYKIPAKPLISSTQEVEAGGAL